MLANYGYKDAAGEFFITINTDKCTGCGDCVSACPSAIFTAEDQDPNDPMRQGAVAIVLENKRKRLRYECGPCKPSMNRPPLPCVEACKAGAIVHSW